MATQTQWLADVEPVFEADVDTDRVLRVLACPRRRYLLALLADRDAPMALADVATDVAAWELDVDRDELSKESIDPVLHSLYHAGGPVLADAGLADYDPERKTIEITDAGHELGDLPTLPAVV